MHDDLKMYMQSLAPIGILDDGFTMILTNGSLLAKRTKGDLIITVWLKSYGLMSIRILN